MHVVGYKGTGFGRSALLGGLVVRVMLFYVERQVFCSLRTKLRNDMALSHNFMGCAAGG